jgi:hypothetical protein
VNRRLNRVALIVGVVVLAVGPLALTLTRASDYHSAATLSLNSSNPSGQYLPNPERLVEEPLEVRDLQRDVARQVDWFDAPDDLADYVTVRELRPDDRTTFAVTARGPSPEEAGELAGAASGSLRDAAEASARFIQPQQLQRIRRSLRREDLPEAERNELIQRRERISASVSENQAIFADAAGPPTLESERLGDRLLGALPGSRPLRPDPVWAGLAGVALALALGLWVLVLSSARPRAR